MKQRWYGVGALVAVLAVLSLSAPAMAAAKQVPFKARSSGVATTTGFDPVAMIAYTRVEGQGQATYLGQFTATAVAEVDVVTGNAHGTWTLTAANGDQLFLTFTAVPSSDSTHGIGTFTIVGGTGRFAGATGFYEQIIAFEEVPGTADATYTDVLTGMISF